MVQNNKYPLLLLSRQIRNVLLIPLSKTQRPESLFKWKNPQLNGKFHCPKCCFKRHFGPAQISTVMLFYCSYYQSVLATQWVMLMLFSSILKPYKASLEWGNPGSSNTSGCYIRQGLSHSETLPLLMFSLAEWI